MQILSEKAKFLLLVLSRKNRFLHFKIHLNTLIRTLSHACVNTHIRTLSDVCQFLCQCDCVCIRMCVCQCVC